MTEKGKLLGIASRVAPKTPMNELRTARITTERGVERDARGKPGRRQVTVITRRSWEAACSEVGVENLPWTARRANLLVDGIELQGKVGYELQIGDALLMISGETTPCERMNQIHPELKTALQPEWRGGVSCHVIRSGDVGVGCNVILRRIVIRQLSYVVYDHIRRIMKKGRWFLAGVIRKLNGKQGKVQPQTKSNEELKRSAKANKIK